MDPKTNPYAPGAGTQPPELAGRDDILKECDVALARVLMGRPALIGALDTQDARAALVEPAEKLGVSFMRAMSELGRGNYKSGDIAKLLGKNTNSFGPVRDGLIRKGMIYSSKHGTLDFTVPLFDQFMRRTVPNL